MNGGYLIISKNQADAYALSVKALELGKPVLFYEDNNTCYYIDTITKSGTDIVLTKGGKSITIESDGTITEVGDVLTIMENIVDINGNKRFIEGDINVNTIDGLDITYGKYSLSGTHLMLVIAGSLDNTKSFGNYFADAVLPEWIINKIFTIYGSTILKNNVNLYSSDGTIQSITVELTKDTVNNRLRFYSGATANADKTFRIEFDLLIDAE